LVLALDDGLRVAVCRAAFMQDRIAEGVVVD
jgi:hypothetical protein